MADISNLRKRRGAIKASITKLTTRMKQLESKVHEPATFELAQQLVPNLNSLDAKYKEHHFSIVDNIDETDEAYLAKEQEVLDNHDEEFSILLPQMAHPSKLVPCLTPDLLCHLFLNALFNHWA